MTKLHGNDAKPARPDILGIVIGVAAPLVFLAILAILSAKVPS